MKFAETKAVLVECPTCGMGIGFPCIKTSAQVGRWSRVERYFRPPHKGRIEAYKKQGSKVCPWGPKK